MPTLVQHRRDLLQALPGPSGVYIITDVATGADPNRWAVVRPAALASLRGSALDTTSLVGSFLHAASGGQDGSVRRIVHQRRSNGAVWFADPLAAGLSVSGVVEIGMLPAYTTQGVRGALETINLALDDLWIEHYLDLTTVANAREYSLPQSSYDFLRSRDRILEDERGPLVYDPRRTATSPRRRSSKRWRIHFNGAAPVLECLDAGYPTANFTFQLGVKRPAKSWINGANSTVGLANASDSAVPDLVEVRTVALLHAYRWLSGWMDLSESERARYAEMAVSQEQACRRLEHYLPRTVPAIEEAA